MTQRHLTERPGTGAPDATTRRAADHPTPQAATRPGKPRAHAISAGALARCYAALWLATGVGAALAAAGARLTTTGSPRDALAANTTTLLGLLVHNAPVALWPLALTRLRWTALAGTRAIGDTLIGAHLVGHGLLVGCAIGQHPDTWRYLPHLPLEWLALAVPAAAWYTARRRPATPPADEPSLTSGTVACLAALAGAAAIETYLVPVG